MSSHPDRVRRNYCEHEFNKGLIYYTDKFSYVNINFAWDCVKCGITFPYPYTRKAIMNSIQKDA